MEEKNIFEILYNIELVHSIIIEVFVTMVIIAIKTAITKVNFLEFFKCSNIDYIILKRKEIKWKYKYLYIKLVENFIMVFLYIIVFQVVSKFSILLLKIRFGIIEEYYGIVVISTVVLSMFVISWFITKLNYKVYDKIKWYCLMFVEGIFLLIFIVNLLQTQKKFLYFISLYCIILCIVLTAILDSFLVKNICIKHKKFFFIFRVLRYVTFYFCIMTMFYYERFSFLFYCIWSTLIIIENTFVLFDSIEYFEFNIHTKNNIIKVNSSIVKLQNSQVLYKTKNGLFNIIDVDDIEFISYDISKRKRKNKKNRVVCMFIDGQKEYYNDYKINKNNWIKLKKDFGAIYKVYIYNIKNIRYFGRKNIT